MRGLRKAREKGRVPEAKGDAPRGQSAGGLGIALPDRHRDGCGSRHRRRNRPFCLTDGWGDGAMVADHVLLPRLCGRGAERLSCRQRFGAGGRLSSGVAQARRGERRIDNGAPRMKAPEGERERGDAWLIRSISSKSPPSRPSTSAASMPHFTNAGLFMAVAVTGVTLFMILAMRPKAAGARTLAVDGRAQLRVHCRHGARQHRDRRAQVLPLHLLAVHVHPVRQSARPGSLQLHLPPAHIIVTFGMAAFVFVGATIIGFARHGTKFFGFFLPEGVPWYIAPILVPIEILSLFSPGPSACRCVPVRQHDRRAYDAEGLRRFRGHAGDLVRLGAAGLRHRADGPGISSSRSCRRMCSPSSPASTCTTRSTCIRTVRSRNTGKGTRTMEVAAAKLIGAGLGRHRPGRRRCRYREHLRDHDFVGRAQSGRLRRVSPLYMWIGFALVEAVALYALLVALMILFTF